MDSDAVRSSQCSRLSRERHLFSRMVFVLGMEPSPSMKVIAFWLWLEENGHRDLVRRIHSLNDGALLDVASVGERFVEALGRLSSAPPSAGRPRFREAAVGGINFYLNGVCRKVLEDVLLVVLSADVQGLRIHGAEEARPAAARRALMGAPPPAAEDVPSLLRRRRRRPEFPAPSLAPQCDDVPPEERTLFVTFSNGHPFTEEELLTFFMRNYGDVEAVSIQEASEGKPPLYAHVTFRTLATLSRVLHGDLKVKFMTHGKHLWARRFIPKRNFTHSSLSGEEAPQ